ncbi:hypothetical protein IP91_00134 [Pseudoduganella lurida]|uniref:Lysis protein n=1 Tax=Pseudoduganella lurida TaxID=1036180 RepID=A0A562RJ12_9BURK|nr:hypothetical protein [Pseudoduganella lurida]TWI69069.1 hypothetical protein IP91_00134 [Pseudoduganella lurida]
MTPAQLKALVIGGGLLGALALAGWSGHWVGAARVQSAWDLDKVARASAQEKAVLAAVTANEKARQADISATKATLATYKENLREANERIVAERAAVDRIRLRISIPTRVCAAAGPGEAPGTGPADAVGAVESIELPEPVERGLRDLAESADSEVARLRAKLHGLQDWVRTHGFYEVGE